MCCRRVGWLVALVGLTGCYTSYNLATQRQEISVTSTARELRMGAAIAQRVLERFEPVEDAAMQARVQTIGERLAAHSDRRDVPYHFSVVEGKDIRDAINAFTIPGGYIFVNQALMEFVKDDDELASVLAHEIGHTAARHPVKRYETLMASSLGQLLVMGAARDRELQQGLHVIFTQMFLAYAREDELLADRLGVAYLRAAGFDPEGAVRLLTRLKRREQRKAQPRVYSYFRTHPYMADRLSVVREAITGRLGFDDYINRTAPGE